ncbi:hypothetical protein C5L14_00640 [Labrys okinawensis]|uniref:Uncharacterized protein n=1 Tax=Labrys okinawensis TaxID=346911 RepID=A0A2S9QIF0_9HYPH|nr:hypothetical protein C5L14_00640 [Labrys okinawensis]
MIAEGLDFPTIWETYLRRHAAVIGPPIQGYRDSEPILTIPLFYRQTLVFPSTKGRFAIE